MENPGNMISLEQKSISGFCRNCKQIPAGGMKESPGVNLTLKLPAGKRIS
jgi:hypothetical protein